MARRVSFLKAVQNAHEAFAAEMDRQGWLPTDVGWGRTVISDNRNHGRRTKDGSTVYGFAIQTQELYEAAPDDVL